MLREGRLRRQRQAGFSLIELMIAVAIFALLTALLYAALWSGSRQLARLQQTRDGSGDLMVARRAFRSVIETMAIMPASEIEADAGTLFVGDPLAMSLVASIDNRGFPEHFRITLAIEQQEGPGRTTLSRLVLRRQRLGSDVAPIETADVLARPGRLSFSYMMIETGEGRWQPAWTAASIIPGRVAVLEDNQPLILASPKASLDPRCVQRRGDQALATDECRVRQ
jgi:prepilin-type N-terminal cleavage/methylation domain-containing protein